MDTAWPGAYYAQVMDSVGVLNDIAQRLDDRVEEFIVYLKNTRSPPQPPLSHTHTHKYRVHAMLFISS